MADYNRGTSGLASLLQGFAQGRKDTRAQQMEEKKLAFVDPNRPIGQRDILEAALKDYSSQMTMAPFMQAQNPAYQPPQLNKLLQTYMQAINGGGQTQAQPIAQMPQAPMATPQSIPSTPASVDRGGMLQAVVAEMRKRGKIQ